VDVVVLTPTYLDYTFVGLEGLPSPGEERFAGDMLRSPGGGGIIALAAARLGLSTALIAPLGDDLAGRYVRHALEGRTVRVEAPSDAEVQVDPRLASAALAHLLENAAQYSPSGQPISVKATAGAGGLEVSVTDYGPGLDPGELDHLFERFYRGRVARQSSFGTGMGLAITRGLLAAAGGRVWAENALGAGARFTIGIPGATRAAAVVE